jgi:hypothetical protein
VQCSQDKLHPYGHLRAHSVDNNEVEYVEHCDELRGALFVLGFHRVPVDAQEEVKEAHEGLQKNQKGPDY